MEEGKSGRRRYSGQAAAALGARRAEGQSRSELQHDKAAQVRDALDEYNTEPEAAAAPASCADVEYMEEQESKEKTPKKRGCGRPARPRLP